MKNKEIETDKIITEADLPDFLKERYVWIRSQDGGETLILREYWKGDKRRCKGTVIPKTKNA